MSVVPLPYCPQGGTAGSGRLTRCAVVTYTVPRVQAMPRNMNHCSVGTGTQRLGHGDNQGSRTSGNMGGRVAYETIGVYINLMYCPKSSRG